MWWLWIVVLPTACAFLLILSAHTLKFIARMQHKKLAKILKKDEILKKLVDEAERKGILICPKGGKISKIRMWQATNYWNSKRIEIPKSSLKEFLKGETNPIIMAIFLAHEMGHFPFLPENYCPLLKKRGSCLYEESRAFVKGFKIMENLEITGWKNDFLLGLVLNILLKQCGHCLSDDKKIILLFAGNQKR